MQEKQQNLKNKVAVCTEAINQGLSWRKLTKREAKRECYRKVIRLSLPKPPVNYSVARRTTRNHGLSAIPYSSPGNLARILPELTGNSQAMRYEL